MSSPPPGAPTLEASEAAARLRPLSIGEIFDRAFTIYFRHVLTFASLLLVVIVPLSFVYYFMAHGLLQAYVDLVSDAFKHPSTPPDPSIIQNAITPSYFAWAGLYYAIAFFGIPLANAAVVSGVSRAYLGLPVRFSECYADARKRWGYVLILSILWFIAVVAVAFAAGFLIVVVVAVSVGIGAVLKVLGIVLGAIFGIAFSIAFTGLIIMSYMAFASSFIACVLEQADPVKSFGLGITRVFGGGQFWRSLLLAFAIGALGIGFVLVAYLIGGLAFWLTKSIFLFLAVFQLTNVFFIGFAFVTVALYYYDVRIRREGFDLQLLAAQLAATSPASPPASP